MVASPAPPTGDLSRNPGMCPDGESNRQPFGFWDNTNPRSHTGQGGLCSTRRPAVRRGFSGCMDLGCWLTGCVCRCFIRFPWARFSSLSSCQDLLSPPFGAQTPSSISLPRAVGTVGPSSLCGVPAPRQVVSVSLCEASRFPVSLKEVPPWEKVTQVRPTLVSIVGTGSGLEPAGT